MCRLKRFSAIFITLVHVGICEEFCDAKTKSCDSLDNAKLLFYDANPQEGFNLKRDVYMRVAIATAERNKQLNHQWNIVLPPWYRLYHWKSEDYWSSKALPWTSFFDLDAFKTYTPVLELFEAFKYADKNKLTMDRVYVLQNFPDAFENGRFVEKWKINQHCSSNLEFWGYDNITANEIICIRFQGRASKLFEIVALHPMDKKVMFVNSEIALHDSYGDKNYWDCRKSMKFSKELLKIAEKYILKNFKCKNNCSYIAVHWRRQDFARSRTKDVPSINGAAEQIKEAAEKKNIDKIFIATDAPKSEIDTLKSHLENFGYKTLNFMPSDGELTKFKDGGVAIIDQIICSNSLFFIGTYESTFTFRIQEEREIMGFDSDTTFNRLCPNTGVCEAMSKWTIVH